MSHHNSEAYLRSPASINGPAQTQWTTRNICALLPSTCLWTRNVHAAWVGVCILCVLRNIHPVWNRRCSLHVVICTVKKTPWLWSLSSDCCLSTWPLALLPSSVFPRQSLDFSQGTVYRRDHSWKTIADANESGFGPSIIQTLQRCCNKLGTLSEPSVPSQAPWELRHIPRFMTCDCCADGLSAAFTGSQMFWPKQPRVQSKGNLWPRAEWYGSARFPLQGLTSKQCRHEQIHPSWHQDHSLPLFHVAV